MTDEVSLSIELERALVRQLSASYEHLNAAHFKRALKKPQIALTSATSVLGRFLPQPPAIELSRAFVLGQPWGVVLEVLKHEMAHQFVSEVLGEQEPAHGPAFRATCERLGIDARARGLPRAADGDDEAGRLLERVSKLLALAQSENQHEAQAATLAAQRLLLRHNLDAAACSKSDHYSFRHLGRITGRVSEWERRLGNILSEHFFVDVIWVSSYCPEQGKRGSVLEAIGTVDNLELASYVYDFLASTGERLFRAHRRQRGVAGRRDRMAYLAGMMSGFAQKLEQQAKVHAQHGLVWVPSDALKVYTRKRHPYLRSVRHQGHRRGEAFQHGQRAGRDLVLHRGITQKSSGHTRLLRD